MGNRRDKWWQAIPWGWVSVTAYTTVLICVACAQALEPGAAALIIKDYQTLIAGLATMAALLIAAEQLRRQTNRDKVDAVRHYEPELEALEDLDRMAALIGNTGSGYRSAIQLDKAQWDKLRHTVSPSIGSGIARMFHAVDRYNNEVDPPGRPAMAIFHYNDTRAREALFAVRSNCNALRQDLEKRRVAIAKIVQDAS